MSSSHPLAFLAPFSKSSFLYKVTDRPDSHRIPAAGVGSGSEEEQATVWSPWETEVALSTVGNALALCPRGREGSAFAWAVQTCCGRPRGILRAPHVLAERRARHRYESVSTRAHGLVPSGPQSCSARCFDAIPKATFTACKRGAWRGWTSAKGCRGGCGPWGGAFCGVSQVCGVVATVPHGFALHGAKHWTSRQS